MCPDSALLNSNSMPFTLFRGGDYPIYFRSSVGGLPVALQYDILTARAFHWTQQPLGCSRQCLSIPDVVQPLLELVLRMGRSAVPSDQRLGSNSLWLRPR
jgi:hypothetical protein